MNTPDQMLVRTVGVAALLVAVCAGAQLGRAQSPTPGELDSIGWTQLMDRLGSTAPSGAGVDFSQIEVAFTNPSYAYAPDSTLGELTGKTFALKSGASGDSTHATNVARNAYGSKGIAPDVTQIDVYQSDSYIAGMLRPLTLSLPAVETRDVENHSWVLLPGGVSYGPELLRRFDYMLDRDNVVSVVGVNNGSASAFPQGMANSYNSIAVGRTDGNSTQGPTTVDVAGRVKPDIVAGLDPLTGDGRNVSTATAWVSGAAALLVETANTSGNVNARQMETIKAALLAGATKDEFDLTGSTATTADDWSHTPTRPLDYRYGAGELNVDNSHRILSAGEFEASTTSDVASTGWDFDTIAAGGANWYFFEVIPEANFEQLSIIATWNRTFDVGIDDGGDGNPLNDIYTFEPRLANIDLRLYQAEDYTAGALLESSTSTIDNVEHLFAQNLPSGRYAINVTSDIATEFAIAWDAILDAPLPGDANLDGTVDGLDYLVWASNFGLGDVGFTQGDFNNDHVVDGLDYIIWSQNYSPSFAAASLSGASADAGTTFGQGAATAIPEPAGVALAVCGAGLLCGWLSRRRR
ncbi:MAG: hypothetical protein R3C10_01035 [Pirellulales bacterium]